MKRLSGLILTAVVCTAAPALAQDPAKSPHAMHGAMAGGAQMTDAAKAFAAANTKMHADMTLDFTGDADTDFVRGMIPHHQGAIDMANVVLKYGKDAELRRLAKGIIAAQDKEIAFMKAWLAKHGK